MHLIPRFVSGTDDLGYAKFSLGPEPPLTIFNPRFPARLSYQTINYDSSSRDLIDTKNIFLPINKVHHYERNALTPTIFCVASLRSGKHLRRSIFGGSRFYPILLYLEIQRRTSVGALTF
jgi:hypothetical protein